jgi:TrmH family RNA methyltransferase
VTGRDFDIESASNPRVKKWTRLSKRAERAATGQFLTEGRRESEHIMSRLKVSELIWCPEYGSSPHLGDVQITTVSKRVFDKVSRRQHPDGIAIVAETPDVSLGSFEPHSPALVLMADGIEKPGNVGGILRTCDALGADFVGSSLSTDVVNPNVIRSAQGSMFATALASVERSEAIDWAIEHTRIVVADPSGAPDLWTQDLRGPTSIVIGSEHAGVDAAWLEIGIPTSIPMAGAADSLNASVSAGIFLSEAVHQRSA